MGMSTLDATSTGWLRAGPGGRPPDGRPPDGEPPGGHFLKASLTFSPACLTFPLAWSALPSASNCSLPIAAPVSFLTLPLTSVTLFAALFSADIGDARGPGATPPRAPRLRGTPPG